MNEQAVNKQPLFEQELKHERKCLHRSINVRPTVQIKSDKVYSAEMAKS